MKKKIILFIYLLLFSILLIMSINYKMMILLIFSIFFLTLGIVYLIYKILHIYKGKVIVDKEKRYKRIKNIKKVSVVIPNYNYAKYIEKRIDSVINQTYPIYELIIIDDCSKDDSVKVIENKIKKIDSSKINIKFIRNEKNSGNVFKAWQKAFQVSTGDYLWIAEADDLCDKYFLNVAMQGFDNNRVVLSYTESKAIDNLENITALDFRDWADIFNTRLWNKNFTITGREMLSKYLSINNSIVNASAVIFKKDKNIPIDKYLKEAQQYKLSGDWYFYSKYLLHGDISYSTDSLNYHRIHNNSVTNNTNEELKYQEIISIQNSIAKDVKIPFLTRIYQYKFNKMSRPKNK